MKYWIVKNNKMPYNDVTNCNIKMKIFQYSQEKYFIKTGVKGIFLNCQRMLRQFYMI